MGSQKIPIAASSLGEFWKAQDYRWQSGTPELQAYQDQFGAVPESSEADWGSYPHDEISAPEFEAAWDSALAYLREHPSSEHFA